MKIKLSILAFGLILFPTQLFAYIDPGSGSAIISAIIGLCAALGLAVKTYWYKIKSIFVSKKSDNDGKS